MIIGNPEDLNGSNAALSIAVNPPANHGPINCMIGAGASAVSSFYITSGGSVLTRRNTLDDMSGNMSVNGQIKFTSPSTTTGLVSANTGGVYLDSSYLNMRFTPGSTTTNYWTVSSSTGSI